MKAAVASAANIFRFNRMDAGFHVELAIHRDRMTVLAEAFSEEQAVGMVAAIELKDLAPLAPLRRRNKGSLRRDEVDGLAAEYPYLCLAIVERHLNTLIRPRAAEQAKASQDYAGRIEDIAEQLAGIGERPAAPGL